MSEIEAAAHELEKLTRELRQRGDSDLAQKVNRVLAVLRAQPGAAQVGPLMTTGQAAAALGIRSVNTIKRWARDGLLEGFRRGGRVLVSERSVRAMAEQDPLARERDFERELAEALEPFDAGDEPPPQSELTWRGRKPWEQGARSRT